MTRLDTMWTAITRTDVGRVRSNNEDLAFWDNDLGVLAVADGMGGHNAGEVASQLAIETLHHVLRQSAAVDAPTAERLRDAIDRANRHVFRTSHERPQFEGMGTTLTAAILHDERVTLASIGDSRLYTFREGELTQRTRDDSLLGALMGVAGVDPVELEHHPMRHLLTSVVGRKPDLDISVETIDVAPGDLLLLSTDGMHGVLSADAIAAILNEESDLSSAAERLIQTALDCDSKDNVTVALARYEA
jgi:protein phosphatase